MGNINPSFFDRVRYTLKSKNFDDIVITEPIGWNDDEKEYARNEEYHGIVAKFSNSLKFVGNGAEYINLNLAVYGINEQIELVREERHPQTDVWTLAYSGFLDLSTWRKEKGEISVKFNAGGLEQLLKARENEKIEIDRITSIDGEPIEELLPITVELGGRSIFLKSIFNVESDNNNVALINPSSSGTVGSTIGVPLNLIEESQVNAQSVNPSLVNDSSWNRTGNGEVSNLFFANSDRERNIRVKFKINFTTKIASAQNIDTFRFYLRLAHYTNDTEYNLKKNYFICQKIYLSDVDNKNFTFEHKQTFPLKKGDSIALLFDQVFDIDGFTGGLVISIENISVDYFIIEEDSVEVNSQTKGVLAYELIDRLVSIATGKKKAFYSDFLGRKDLGYSDNGDGSFTGVAHGFWIRGFEKSSEENNLFKPLTTNFKEAITSLGAVWNIGIGIEKTGNKEVVRLEELGYFYNRNVTIRLPNQVKNVKRSIAVDKYYSSLEFGYEQGGRYEEALGLDEYNTKTTYTTAINRVVNVFSKVSKYRADSYGMEFARRKKRAISDTEDTPYDNEVFLMDLKTDSLNFFKERLWQDDFEKAPTGVYSPDTATNLRFSPINCMFRHSWWFSGGLKAYLSDYVRYGSSIANSKLSTKMIGKNEYAEDSNVINSELLNPRFLNQQIEFEHVCDFEVMQQINGTTVVLGKKIMNFYGLVEFINEENEKERGFLMNLKPNGKGQFTVLKANR